MDEVAAYAQHFIDGSPVPALTNFPKGQKPMLYQLLRTSVYRTATAPDPVSSAVNTALDAPKVAGWRQGGAGAQAIWRNFAQSKGGPGIPEKGRSLRGLKLPWRILLRRGPLRNCVALASRLKDDAKREAKNKDYPAAGCEGLGR